MTNIEDIFTLIEQGNSYLDSEYPDLIESYYTDAWITLKQYLKENEINSLQEIDEDSSLIIDSWFNSLDMNLSRIGEYKALLDILTDSLVVLQLNLKTIVNVKRAIAECYYNLNDHDLAIQKYEEYLKEYPLNDTILYGYALMNNELNNYPKAIELFSILLSDVKDIDPLLKEASLEILIDIYQKIGEIEKANKLRNNLH